MVTINFGYSPDNSSADRNDKDRAGIDGIAAKPAISAVWSCRLDRGVSYSDAIVSPLDPLAKLTIRSLSRVYYFHLQMQRVVHRTILQTQIFSRNARLGNESAFIRAYRSLFQF